MVSKRQRVVKARRKEKEMTIAYLKHVAQKIREESFRSLPVDVRTEVSVSPSRDNGIRNSEGDMPGQVGTGTIDSTSLKDIYRFAWPEDLEYARKILNKVIK